MMYSTNYSRTLLDQKDPSPCSVFGKNTTHYRTQDSGCGEDYPNKTSNPLPHVWRADLREDDHGKRVQTGSTYPLESSEGDELVQRLCKAAPQGKGKEDDERRRVSISASDNVADSGEQYC